MVLSIFSALSYRLEQYTNVLKDWVIDFGHNPTLASAMTVGVFLIGCLIISMLSKH